MDDEFSKLVVFEKEKRRRGLIRRIAQKIDQLDTSSAGEFCEYIQSMVDANDVALAVHTLRLAYEARRIENPQMRRELNWLIGCHRVALEQLLQCKYDFEVS